MSVDSGTENREVSLPQASEERRGGGRRTWLTGGRIVWLSLILLPVVVWAVLLIFIFTREAVPIATGDALLDRYFAALARSGEVGRRELTSYYDPSPGQLEDAVFAGWEAEFGDDPRFWLLRYYLTKDIPPGYEREYGYLGVSPATYYLEEARRRGAVDGAVLLTLLRQNESAWWSEADPYVAEPQPQQRNDDWAPCLAAYRAVVDAFHGDEQCELLAELFTAAPGEALPHYCAALYESERGNYETALQQLALGNRAPSTNALAGFPYDALWERMRAGKPLPDKPLCGAVSRSSGLATTAKTIRVRTMVEILLSRAIEREDRETLAELHTFGCRLGNADGQTLSQARLGCTVVDLVCYAVGQGWPGHLSADQKMALSELDSKLQNTHPQLWMPVIRVPVHSPLQLAESLLTGGRSLATAQLETLHDDAVSGQSFLGAHVGPLFEELERFDYTRFSWKE